MSGFTGNQRQKVKSSADLKHNYTEENHFVETIFKSNSKESAFSQNQQKANISERSQGGDEVHIGNMESASSIVRSQEYYLQQPILNKNSQQVIVQKGPSYRLNYQQQQQQSQIQRQQQTPLTKITNYPSLISIRQPQQTPSLEAKKSPLKQQASSSTENFFIVKQRLCQSDAKSQIYYSGENGLQYSNSKPSVILATQANQDQNQKVFYQLNRVNSAQRSVSPSILTPQKQSPLRTSPLLAIRSVSPVQNRSMLSTPTRSNVCIPAPKPSLNCSYNQIRENTPIKVVNSVPIQSSSAMIDSSTMQEKELKKKYEQIEEELRKCKIDQQNVLEEKNKQLGRALQELEKLLIDNTTLSERCFKTQEQLKNKIIEMTKIKQDHLDEMGNLRKLAKEECTRMVDIEVEKIIGPLIDENSKLEISLQQYIEDRKRQNQMSKEKIGESENWLLRKQNEEIIQENDMVQKENKETIRQNDELMRINSHLIKQNEELIKNKHLYSKQLEKMAKDLEASAKVNQEMQVQNQNWKNKYEGISKEMVIVREQFLKYLNVVKTFKSFTQDENELNFENDEDIKLLEQIKRQYEDTLSKQTHSLNFNVFETEFGQDNPIRYPNYQNFNEKDESTANLNTQSDTSNDTNFLQEQKSEYFIRNKMQSITNKSERINTSSSNGFDYINQESQKQKLLSQEESRTNQRKEQQQKQAPAQHKRIKSIENRELRLICLDDEDNAEEEQQQNQKTEIRSERKMMTEPVEQKKKYAGGDEFSFTEKEEILTNKSNQAYLFEQNQMMVANKNEKSFIRKNFNQLQDSIQIQEGLDNKYNSTTNTERRLANVECIESVKIESEMNFNQIESDDPRKEDQKISLPIDYFSGKIKKVEQISNFFTHSRPQQKQNQHDSFKRESEQENKNIINSNTKLNYPLEGTPAYQKQEQTLISEASHDLEIPQENKNDEFLELRKKYQQTVKALLGLKAGRQIPPYYGNSSAEQTQQESLALNFEDKLC